MPRTRTISDQTLIEGCRATFLAEGLGVSTRRLARSVGVSEGVLFQRFATKDELFFACMRLPRPQLQDVLARALRRKTLQSGLVLVAEAGLEYLRSQMPVLLLVLAHPRHRDSSHGAGDGHAWLQDARTMHEPFATLLATHPHCDTVAPGDHSATVGLLVSALLARAMHEQLGVEDRAGEKRWLRGMVAALADGFSAR